MNIDETIKSVFKYYMSDSEVVATINSTINSNINYFAEDGNLQEKYRDVQKLDESCYRTIEEKLSCILKRQEKIERIIDKLVPNDLNNADDSKNSKNNYEAELDEYKELYRDFYEQAHMWNKFKELDYEKKEYLKKLCGSLNLIPVLSLGRDEGKIEQLWSYIKDLILKGNQDKQIEILVEYFEYCIRILNEYKYDEPQYSTFRVEEGTDFDMDTCIRTSDSRQIGTVSKTLVSGIKQGDKVIFKSIVRVM